MKNRSLLAFSILLASSSQLLANPAMTPGSAAMDTVLMICIPCLLLEAIVVALMLKFEFPQRRRSRVAIMSWFVVTMLTLTLFFPALFLGAAPGIALAEVMIVFLESLLLFWLVQDTGLFVTDGAPDFSYGAALRISVLANFVSFACCFFPAHSSYHNFEPPERHWRLDNEAQQGAALDG